MAVAKPITVPRLQEGPNRRKLLMALPFAGAALAYPHMARAEPQQETVRDLMIGVIDRLEAWQVWEAADVIAAKAFAAWQMRGALGLDLPDPRYAQMHVDFQQVSFERYRGSVSFERDIAAGKQYGIQPTERKLA